MFYNYVDGQTPIDEDEKSGLIPNINTKDELNEFEQDNIIEARIWAINERILKKENIFTEAFVVKLHKKMFGNVWKWAGQYRKTNKNIGVEAYKIPFELHYLLDDANYWLENKTYNMTEIAIIFHHRLVKIHLFPNGNGRHARLCADAIIKKYNCTKLSWGASRYKKELVEQPNLFRKKYIQALQDADKGNYLPLIEFSI